MCKPPLLPQGNLWINIPVRSVAPISSVAMVTSSIAMATPASAVSTPGTALAASPAVNTGRFKDQLRVACPVASNIEITF